MSTTFKAFIGAAFIAASTITFANAEPVAPAKWSDPDFVLAAQCLAVAVATNQADAPQWAAKVKAQRVGRADWVVDDANDASRIALRIVRQGKNGGSRAKELDALKTKCATLSA